MISTSSHRNIHSISVTHPALPGHFPGNPIVPGVIILNAVFTRMQQDFPQWELAGIRKLKFLQPLAAAQFFVLHYGIIKDDRMRFQCLFAADATPLVEGHLKLRQKEA